MANWVIAAHERWFGELFRRLREELLSNEILHADEITLTVLWEDGRKATQCGCIGPRGTAKGLRYCNKLFELKAGYAEKKLFFQERFLERKKRSVSTAEEFFSWAQNEYDHNPVPKSAYGAALS